MSLKWMGQQKSISSYMYMFKMNNYKNFIFSLKIKKKINLHHP